MKPANQVTACVVDNGLFCDLAATLARTYRKVYYCLPGATYRAFRQVFDAKIGTSLAPNMDVVESIFGEPLDRADLFVFPDVNYGPLQEYIASLGKPVWGSKRGEDIELNRAGTKRLMRRLGLPVGEFEVVIGMDALREYIKAHPGVHVKIDKYRLFETFQAKDYDEIKPRLDDVEMMLGPFSRTQKFIVEADLPDKAEIGMDAYAVDGQFPSKLLAGIEVKNESYVGIFKPYAKFPECLRLWCEKMAPVLKGYGYRGPLSNDIRVGADGIGYMIDACCRTAAPPNELYQELYTNFADIVWQGANGILVDPAPAAKWGVEVLIYSAWAEKHPQPIVIPEAMRLFVKLRNACKVDGTYYVLPQTYGLVEIGAVTGWGDSLDAARTACQEHAKAISGYELSIKTGALDEAEAEIEKTEAFGLGMF